ncbi:hypothetical protein C4J65_25390 [Streptomyces sp. CB09001]|uniref:hypothetical protein n=1 Tax=Streptomyces sp. CB09001 TaxID=2083284 RepID=UPI000E2158A9|nr:hypothetical protein [Streptomyces sp. CB09001]AXL91268.1 hypothetical protein C4J65_25390 [Streptomyces sp. CB09001]
MSFSPSPRLPRGPRRRSLLASAAGAALLAGCTGGSGSGEAGAGPSAVERAQARAARDSEELAARYAAVIAAHPGLAERLRPLREEVVRHAEAFGAVSAASPTASGTAAGTAASPSASVRAAGPANESGGSDVVPTDEKGALALLAGAERKLADRRARTLLDVPGESARLLASVAAAGAAHVFLLTEG